MIAATTYFLNVDLDLNSKKDLGPLLEALGEKVIVLHSGKTRGIHRVSLELYGASPSRLGSRRPRFAVWPRSAENS